MNKSDFIEFKNGMMMLAEVYRVEVNQAQMSIYWDALAVLSIDELLLSIRKHISDTDQGQWFPKPANLLKQVHGNEAQSAWAALCDELSRGGSDVGPKTIAAITAAGGLYNVRRMTAYQLDHYRKQFIDSYCADLAEKPAQIGNQSQAIKSIGAIE
ncbi:hypothetical protein OAA60_01060 [Porticoccaceae bacterium]|nr:hypothetical protein [Porticoccaceae bacterium]